MATVDEVAKHLGMSHKNANELINKGVIARKERGGYDLDEARGQYIAHVREIAAGRAKVGELDLQEERARLAKEQADAKEMENEVLRGSLVSIEDVALSMEKQLTRVRTRLLSVPTKVAPEAHASPTVKEVQRLLEDAIIEALNELVGNYKESAEPEAER